MRLPRRATRPQPPCRTAAFAAAAAAISRAFAAASAAFPVFSAVSTNRPGGFWPPERPCTPDTIRGTPNRRMRSRAANFSATSSLGGIDVGLSLCRFVGRSGAGIGGFRGGAIGVLRDLRCRRGSLHGSGFVRAGLVGQRAGIERFLGGLALCRGLLRKNPLRLGLPRQRLFCRILRGGIRGGRVRGGSGRGCGLVSGCASPPSRQRPCPRRQHLHRRSPRRRLR